MKHPLKTYWRLLRRRTSFLNKYFKIVVKALRWLLGYISPKRYL